MKQKRTTLRSFIKNFPVESFKKEERPLPDLKELSYDKLYELSGPSFPCEVLSVKDESIYYALKGVSVSRVGKKFFKSVHLVEYLYISPTEVNIDRCKYVHISKFLELAGIDWFKDIPERIRSNYFRSASILKSILVKTIYNEETFYKAIAKRIFHIDISWRVLKRYCESKNYLSLIDLFAFSVKPERGLIRFLDSSYTLQNELRDLLHMAVQLGQTIDFTWSETRIKEEHQKQIEIKQAAEIATKSIKLIYEGFDLPEHIRLLNTELDVFMESTTMHHCLYSCYWNKIKSHRFIAFHMTAPEDCTFSVILKDKIPILEQCHLKYNSTVAKETKELILKFIEDHNFELIKMFDQKTEEDPFDLPLPFYNEDVQVNLDIRDIF